MRFERKYLLDRDTAFLLRQRLSYVLAPDNNGDGGSYKVSSIYFDDRYNTALYEKQHGFLCREKLRLRWYNDSLDIIHLESKQKQGELIRKERESITVSQYEMMRRGEYSFIEPESSPLFERFYTTHLLRGLRPVVTVDYDRRAYVHPVGDVRVTFDCGVAAKMPMAGQSFVVLPEKNVILEIKYSHFMPVVIAKLFSGFQLTQQLSISKFYMAKLVLQGK